jgi:hypothetical protein
MRLSSNPSTTKKKKKKSIQGEGQGSSGTRVLPVFELGGPSDRNKEGLQPSLPHSKAAGITYLFLPLPVKCIRSTPEYFAERLFKSMKVCGVGVSVVEGGGLCPPHRTVGTLGQVLDVN